MRHPIEWAPPWRPNTMNGGRASRQIVLPLSGHAHVCIEVTSDVTWEALSSISRIAEVGSSNQNVGVAPHRARSQGLVTVPAVAAMCWELSGVEQSVDNKLLLALSTCPHDESGALQAGADVFAVLPLDWQLLAARLCAIARRHARLRYEPEANRMKVSLDTAERVLHAGNVSVQLSQREYELITHLYEQREHWVPRPWLFAALRIGEAGNDPSLLRTHIFNVRSKLGPWRWILRSDRSNGLMLTTRREALNGLTEL